jgi:uncharacterized membrane protein (UPF0127 family)
MSPTRRLVRRHSLGFPGISIVAALALAWLATPLARGAEQQTVEIASRSGVHSFMVDLAVTEDERQRGLMFRKSLPDSYGMLFDFKQDQEVSMWMHNTYVSLDMIFIEADGRIHRIAEKTKTLSDAIISSQGPVRAVLEVAAGTAQRYGIQAGDRVAAPMFRR